MCGVAVLRCERRYAVGPLRERQEASGRMPEPQASSCPCNPPDWDRWRVVDCTGRNRRLFGCCVLTVVATQFVAVRSAQSPPRLQHERWSAGPTSGAQDASWYPALKAAARVSVASVSPEPSEPSAAAPEDVAEFAARSSENSAVRPRRQPPFRTARRAALRGGPSERVCRVFPRPRCP